ncbi:MAG TPA: hypothetical protein VM659_08815 [Dongiaceae bacterium]|nr:hypothetical protein [Dongiaceae bacterium]
MRPIWTAGMSLWREEGPARRAVFTALLIALTGSLTGCAGWYPSEEGYRQTLDTWIGSTGEQLVAKWGVPAGEHVSTDGSKLFEYKDTRSYTVSGGTRSEQVKVDGNYVWVDIPQPDETRTTWCNTTFHLNADDIIESYYFKGPDCTAYEK